MSTAFRPTFSIVTATMNCRDLLQKTLDSVRLQTHDRIQHIIIDGGSTDGTGAVLKARLDELYYVISEPDKNLYDAMNKGLAQATGDFVFFLNSGDVFASNTVLAEVAKAIEDPNLCYFGQVKIIARFGSWLMPPEVNDHVADGSFLPHHQSIFYPKTFYMNNRYEDGFKIHADIDFTRRLADTCPLRYMRIVIVESVMGGVATEVFRSYRKTRDISSEFIALANRAGTKPNLFARSKIYAGCVLKFAICKIFGDDVLHQLYRLAANVRFRRYQ
jgi:glycosyltransferase involved in cell wall biosynthesis